ncbi:hypothetical protein BJ875DRAFT_464991 [Amylocarpus encephaloides]|uniref:DUF5672 domain-containing protein n=1 Tax=Amylocarpus encephaloides TaxID=45428 RepID=A0A9P7YGE8_9HELO|nr:hypothetical protein BJ875DRAFT_464991 [Amylocarpus encephaloides]
MSRSWRTSEVSLDSEPFLESSSVVQRKKPGLQSYKSLSLAAGVLIVTVVLLVVASVFLRGAQYSLLPQSADSSPKEDSVLPESPSGIPISTEKAAVIVENRPLQNLIPIILHFSSVLGPEWPIHVFTSKENMHIFSDSKPFQRNVERGRFQVRPLPDDETLSSHASVSAFFSKPWFWEQMAPAEHLLMFQADSILCSRAPQKVEDFLEYDFVGAPIRGDLGKGYNGGLSIRNRTMCLEITSNYDWQVERHGDHSEGNVDYEDQWFCKKIREFPGSHLPDPDVAMKFSVETIWYEKPLGYHQPNMWQGDHMAEIYNWCPEYRMCTTETFTDHNTEDFSQ